jgi:hypothetical protein
MKKPRLAVVISDLHCGSSTGLMKTGFHTKNGNEIGLNDVQKWIWESWQDAWKWFYKMAGNEPWTFIINGDAIDGSHHGTTEIWSNDESDHGIAAYHVLKEHARRADSVLIGEGTQSHTKGHEHALAYQLESGGAKIIRPKGQGGAWETINIEQAGTYCKYDHHIQTSKRKYLTGTKLTAEMGDLIMRKAMAGHRMPKVIGRAHCHEFDMHKNSFCLTFTTPPWQACTRYARQVVPNANDTIEIGMVVLDWRWREDGETPILLDKTYTIKEPSIHKL